MSANREQVEIDVEPAEVARWLAEGKKVTLIDVREPYEREAGRIEPSLHIELGRLSDEAAWDVFKIPHHSSYLSMAAEKGTYKTKPTPEFEWLLSQGTKQSIMVSTSWEIPSETTDQPPHVETYRRYKETADLLDGDLIVTMEHPTKHSPKRVVIEIGANGITLKREISTAGAAAYTSTSPRVG